MTKPPLARRQEVAAVYGAGLIQGVALVTFPAASVVFTSATGYGLSRTEYGGMFVPQAVTAIGSALLGAGLARRLGAKRIFLIGLVANLASMALLVLSRFVMSEHAVAYVVLLVATTGSPPRRSTDAARSVARRSANQRASASGTAPGQRRSVVSSSAA